MIPAVICNFLIRSITFQISQKNRSDAPSKSFSSVTAVENLDLVTRTSCSELDYFVIFSTNTTSKDKDGILVDLSHAAAERICGNRRAEGFPSVC